MQKSPEKWERNKTRNLSFQKKNEDVSNKMIYNKKLKIMQ